MPKKSAPIAPRLKLKICILCVNNQSHKTTSWKNILREKSVKSIIYKLNRFYERHLKDEVFVHANAN